MGFFSSMNISATALTAQRLRMDTISENIANVNTTRTADGGPFKRRTVIFEEIHDVDPMTLAFDNIFGSIFGGTPAHQSRGVRVSQIVRDETPGLLKFDPSHPDANEDGYVRLPNVNIVEEMVNMISTTRSYEANITAMQNSRHIMQRTLEIGQGR